MNTYTNEVVAELNDKINDFPLVEGNLYDKIKSRKKVGMILGDLDIPKLEKKFKEEGERILRITITTTHVKLEHNDEVTELSLDDYDKIDFRVLVRTYNPTKIIVLWWSNKAFAGVTENPTLNNVELRWLVCYWSMLMLVDIVDSVDGISLLVNFCTTSLVVTKFMFLNDLMCVCLDDGTYAIIRDKYSEVDCRQKLTV